MKFTGKIAVDPWREVIIPEPPDGAPREQLFEFAAIAGLYGENWGSITTLMKRTSTAYMERWHEDMELPPI